MKYLKKFNESISAPTMEEVCDFLDQFASEQWNRSQIEINSDGTVDFDGDLSLNTWRTRSKDIHLGRLPFKFRNVTGSFSIGRHLLVTTLEGCPDTCQSFSVVCEKGNLSDLRGGPKYVNYSYFVRGPITSLEGSPDFVGEEFNCIGGEFTDLEGSPRTIDGFLELDDCKNLISMKGCTPNVPIIRLLGVNLQSLDFIPHATDTLEVSTINQSLWDPTPLKDNKGLVLLPYKEPILVLMELFDPNLNRPKLSRGGTSFLNKAREFQEKICELFIESLDYNWIRPNREINLFRLSEAFREFNLELPSMDPKEILGNHYKLVGESGEYVDFSGRPYDYK